MSDKVNRSYIESKLDAILHAMTTKTFLANPPDHIEFMMQYLQEHHGKRPGVNENERLELEILRKEVAQLKLQLGTSENGSEHSTESAGEGSEISSEDEEEDEEVADLIAEPVSKPPANRGPRVSVCAEVFGNWNKKEDFKAPVHQKSDQVKQALQQRLDQAFMFNALNPAELEIVLGAMYSVPKKAGEVIIQEGDDGDNLYVVEKGTLNCSKVFVSYTHTLVAYHICIEGQH